MNLRHYALVTAAYWGFTLTDGALRLLVLLHFHRLGFSPVQLAVLFLLYELCGMATNLLGGWLGSRFGLRSTLFSGLALQVVALVMLSLLDEGWLQAASLAYVMVAQALSGVAKDLTKMSSKSAVKLVVSEGGDGGGGAAAGGGGGRLFQWVAVLTGSKNALKGAGFFLGGALLAALGFRGALWAMAGGLAAVLAASVLALPGEMGVAKAKVKFSRILSKSPEINWLSAARCFLFGSRDVWFVVALPIFFARELGWGFTAVGTFMALWVIGYGAVQSAAPTLLKGFLRGRSPGGGTALAGAAALTVFTAGLAALLQAGFDPAPTLVAGLGLFGVLFALNSSVHSYLVLAYTDHDKVALDVGFYYMANAGGRLLGTLLSGLVFQWAGLAACLYTSAALLALASACSAGLPRERRGGEP